MKVRFLCTLLIFMTLLSNTLSFGKRCSSKCKQRSIQDVQLTNLHNRMNDPQDYSGKTWDCCTAGFGIVQKIPYARSGSDCHGIDINFSSVCIRCGMCSTIAQKINQTLIEVHEIMSGNHWLNDTEAILLLRTICDVSFALYQLQEINGKRYLSDHLPGATFLTTSADGLWGQKLQATCREYLDAIGELKLFEYWRRWYRDGDAYDLTNILCRNMGGILRDCSSMDHLDVYESPYQPYYIKMRTSANRYG